MKNHLVLLICLISVDSFAQTKSLWNAVKNNNIEQIEYSLLNGADINSKDENDAPIIWWAVYKGDLKLVKFLINKGFDYTFKNGAIYLNKEKTVFYGSLNAIATGEDKLDILKYLIEDLNIPVDSKEYHPKTKMTIGWTALQWALIKEKDIIVDYLLKKGAKLTVIDSTISENRYDEMLTAFNSFKKQKYLRYTSVSYALTNPKNVFYLNLKGQSIKKLNTEIFNLENLKVLDLSSNQIEEIPKLITRLQKLQIIRCNNNKLKFIPIEISLLKNLKVLDIKDNQISSIPKEIINFEGLEISCSGNNFTLNNEGLVLISELNREILEIKKNFIQQQKKSIEKEKIQQLRRLAEIQDKNDDIFRTSITLIVTIFVLIILLLILFFINRGRTKDKKINKILLIQNKELESSNLKLKELTEELKTSEEELKQQAEELASQRDKLAESTTKLEELLEETQTLQATKDLMISAINHDLRNPLNPIINYSSPNFPNPDKSKLLQKIHFRSKRMKTMVEEVMYIYQADKLEMQKSSNQIRKTIQSAITLIADYQSQMPEIRNEVSESLQGIYNEDYIRRVVENLLVNAVKFSNGVDNPTVIVSALVENGKVHLQIQDNGWGIPPEKLKELQQGVAQFDNKRSTSEKGFGIGLQFCNTVLRLHESHLEIHSEGEDKGSTFGFALPQAQGNIQASSDQAQPLNLEDAIQSMTISAQIKEVWQPYLADLKAMDLYDSKLDITLKTIEKIDESSSKIIKLIKECIKLDEEKLYQVLLGKLEV